MMEMTAQQKMWFALLGANLDRLDVYMSQPGNNLHRSLRALRKYDNLPDTAWQWVCDLGYLDIKP